MCDCLKNSETKISAHIEKQLKEKGVVICEITENHYQHKGLSLGKGGGWKLFMPFEFKYIRQKKDGTPEKKQTDASINIYPTFCPFCGVKIEN